MSDSIPDLKELQQRLSALEAEWEEMLNAHIKKQESLFHYHLEQGKVRFEAGIKHLQASFKTSVWSYLLNAHVGHVLSAPIIYAMVFPLTFLDLTISLYQQICFRIYGIERVNRREYVVMDRQYLAYLNMIEKLNCIYCGYGNGVVSYAREVIARTEQFWCPIRHASRVSDPHRLMVNFVDYGDAEGYRQRLRDLRSQLSQVSGQARDETA